jgi:hypothetical protein
MLRILSSSEEKTMKWHLVLPIALLIMANAARSSSQSNQAPAPGRSFVSVPLRDVPAPLRDVWLRFHESELCLNLDTVFVFLPKGMEIWCRVKDERSYQELVSMVEPLRSAYRIELYATRPDRDKKPSTSGTADTLPSLWNNSELRMYMRDPFSIRYYPIFDDPNGTRASDPSDAELRRRLSLFGDQVLDWARKMERLASDLPALGNAAYGTDAPVDTRMHARAVCQDHAREVGKDASRLLESLSHALPRGKNPTSPSQPQYAPAEAAHSPYDRVMLISNQAVDLAQRVVRFLYPQTHTVNLADLRESSLVDALKALQKTVSDFESNSR